MFFFWKRICFLFGETRTKMMEAQARREKDGLKKKSRPTGARARGGMRADTPLVLCHALRGAVSRVKKFHPL
jgi:hypothetical protein